MYYIPLHVGIPTIAATIYRKKHFHKSWLLFAWQCRNLDKYLSFACSKFYLHLQKSSLLLLLIEKQTRYLDIILKAYFCWYVTDLSSVSLIFFIKRLSRRIILEIVCSYKKDSILKFDIFLLPCTLHLQQE